MTKKEVFFLSRDVARKVLQTYFRNGPDGFPDKYFNDASQSGKAAVKKVYDTLEPLLLTEERKDA